jgi:hypothetical protein
MKKSGKGGSRYFALSGLSILLMGLAGITVLPHPGSHVNMLGYRSICGFVPLSTVILLGAAVVVRVVRDMQSK